MTKTEQQKQQLDVLHTQIWDICCEFWGKMSADDYKDYVLGLLFYRYLSENVETTIDSLFTKEGWDYLIAWNDSELKQSVSEDLLEELGYIIEPQYLFSNMMNMILVEKAGFDIEYLQNAINSLMESTFSQPSGWVFDGIFDDMDLHSSKLGRAVSARSELVTRAMTAINKIDFKQEDSHIDILGDTYEYLIGKFAAGAGQKSGSYYTPAQVGVLLGRLVTLGRDQVENAFDACGGSGSLLLHVGNQVDVVNYYYQELTTNTYNLARMNMLLHNVGYEKLNMENDDTLENPAYLEVPMDVIVTNPPYSQRWTGSDKYLKEERFSNFGTIPPKSYADYAFLMSMFQTLKKDGTMAVLLPHGVLFRGGKEREIRKVLIDKGYIDLVIGLPANVFFGTSIPVVCLVLKKDKKDRDIYFIDASKDFVKEGNKNYITDDAIGRIINAYNKKEEIEKYAHLAKFSEIAEDNDYNLNIPRFVDTFEEDEPINLAEVQAGIVQLIKKSDDLEKQIIEMASQLIETGGTE